MEKCCCIMKLYSQHLRNFCCFNSQFFQETIVFSVFVIDEIIMFICEILPIPCRLIVESDEMFDGQIRFFHPIKSEVSWVKP